MRLIDKTWNAGKKVVNVVSPIFYLTKEDSKVLRPLKNSGKRQGTYWGRAYQAVKHDRYESMPNGNIKALLGAMAALYLLNIYYRNDSWLTKNSDINSQNWSMGSTVFFSIAAHHSRTVVWEQADFLRKSFCCLIYQRKLFENQEDPR